MCRNALYAQMTLKNFEELWRKLVDFWSGRPCLRETPTFKHVHPSAYAPALLNVQLSL